MDRLRRKWLGICHFKSFETFKWITVGSIQVGKDADVVLWSENPLSVYTNP